MAEGVEAVPEEDSVEEASSSDDVSVEAKRPRLEDDGSNPPSAQLKVLTQAAALLLSLAHHHLGFLPERFNLTAARL